MLFSVPALAALVGGCTLVDAARIDTDDGSFRLRQVIEGGCPALTEAGDTVIAALPRGMDRVTLSRVALAGLIRRRVPDLAIVEPATSARGMELYRSEPTATGAGPACFELAHALGPSEVLTQDAVSPATCTQEQTPLALTYDSRTGIVRTAESGEAGHYVGQLMALRTDLIEQGQPLQLRITSGPVTIVRDVVALQPSSAGDGLFVRDAEGHIFSAPSEGAGERRP